MSIKNDKEIIQSIIKYLKYKENYNLTELKDIEIIIEKILEEIKQEQPKSQLEQCIELLESQYILSVKECFEIKTMKKILSSLQLNNQNILEYFTQENIEKIYKEMNNRYELQLKLEKYISIIKEKIDKKSKLYYEIMELSISNKDKDEEYVFELEKIREFISQTTNPLNQLHRVHYNIINYNTFISLMLSILTNDKQYVSLTSEDTDTFILSISSFILGMQYDHSVNAIDNEYFSEEVRQSQHTIRPNNTNVSISKIIRNAIAHGEYYLHDKNGKQYIKIENSGRTGKFLELEISYEEFLKHIKENYITAFKDNYPMFLPLASMVESGINYESLKLDKKNSLISLLALNAFNIIEYNTQHHFKEISNLDNILDISDFNFVCSPNSRYHGRNITVYELLENVKNAIGHGNINYNDKTEEIEFNNTNPHRNPPEWVSTTKIHIINLIKFFGNQSLYNISTQTSERTNEENIYMNYNIKK